VCPRRKLAPSVPQKKTGQPQIPGEAPIPPCRPRVSRLLFSIILFETGRLAVPIFNRDGVGCGWAVAEMTRSVIASADAMPRRGASPRLFDLIRCDRPPPSNPTVGGVGGVIALRLPPVTHLLCQRRLRHRRRPGRSQCLEIRPMATGYSGGRIWKSPCTRQLHPPTRVIQNADRCPARISRPWKPIPMPFLWEFRDYGIETSLGNSGFRNVGSTRHTLAAPAKAAV